MSVHLYASIFIINILVNMCMSDTAKNYWESTASSDSVQCSPCNL